MNSKRFSIILALIIAALLIAAGYTILSKKTQPEIVSPQNTTSNNNLAASNTKPIPKDETENWKTYSNSEYTFTFKYPANFILDISDTYPYSVALRPPSSLQNELGSYLEIDPINVGRESVFDPGANPSCKITVINFGGRSARECKESRTDITYRNIQITDLNNIKWEKDNELGFEITGTNPALAKTYNQILDSFKFTK
jgi:hypothetical protein